MEFVNLCQENKNEFGKDAIEKFLILISPFAPHIAEELWKNWAIKRAYFWRNGPSRTKNYLKKKRSP